MKEYKITFEEYFHANSLIMGLKKWFFLILYLFGMNGFLVSLFYIYPPFDKDLVLSYFMLLLALLTADFLVIVVWPKSQRKELLKMYDTNKEFQKLSKLTFNEEFLEWSSDSGNYKIDWKDLYQYEYDDKMVIVYAGENCVRLVPIRAFESENEKEKFFNLLKANVKQKQ